MNPKDLAHFRRNLKPDTELMKIFDILHVYILKNSSEIYHLECHPFALLEREQQELYLTNFKKMLTGAFDEKLFELRYQAGEEDTAQMMLHRGLQAEPAEQWQDEMLRIAGLMLQQTQYEQDMVLTFLRGQYHKPVKRTSEETEQHAHDEVYALNYTLFAMNRVEHPEKTLVFDYVNKAFKYQIGVDPVVKLGAPEAGFLFPCFNDGIADVNHVLYAAPKANEPDHRFIEEVLGGEIKPTALEEKTVFEDIVREVAGDQLPAGALAQVYEEIHQLIEQHEEDTPPMLDYRDVERVLTAGGVEQVSTEKVERAFEHVLDDVKHEFKAASVMPKYTSKSIKINTKIATITISPQDLKYVKQVAYRGRTCLLIEVDEDTVIEGFTMKTEEL